MVLSFSYSSSQENRQPSFAYISTDRGISIEPKIAALWPPESFKIPVIPVSVINVIFCIKIRAMMTSLA